MAPKRKNNSGNKKRRPKTDKAITPNLTPNASPSKETNTSNHSTHPPSPSPDHTPTKKINHASDKSNLQAQSSINNGPNKSQDNRSNNIQQKAVPDTVSSHVDPSPLTQRVMNIPESNPKSNHHQTTEFSDQSSLPTKSTINQSSGKQAPGVYRVQGNSGSTENSADHTVYSKPETPRTSDLLSKPNSNSHSVDRNTTQPQRPADRVLREIQDHNNPLMNGSSKPSEKSKPRRDQSDTTPLKPLQDPAKSSNHDSSSIKKPIKHVKFTGNLKNDPSQQTLNQENHKSDHIYRLQTNRETGNQGDSLDKHLAVRREMSGAADQFDFDAQQRQHAGPGGGMVKKPRHTQTNINNSISSVSTSGELSQVSSDSSPNESVDELNHPKRQSNNKGFQHAQRCLQSMLDTRNIDQPTDLDPDLFQIYLSYFDQNEDGLLDPLDTWRAFRRLGFSLIIATLATISLHAMMIPFIGVRSWLMPNTLGLCHLPIGHNFFESIRTLFNITTTSLSRYVCVDHQDHHYPDKIGPSMLWKETREHIGVHQMTDPIGWLRVIFGWIIAISLTWPSDLTVKSDLVDGVFNGEILFLVAHRLST